MAEHRPAQALARSVMLHCPLEPCHTCIISDDPNGEDQHHEHCLNTESFWEDDEATIKCDTIFKQEITQHFRDDSRDVGKFACMCRVTLGDIVEMKIVANEDKDFSGVIFGIVAPEVGGNQVFWTEPLEVKKLEDTPFDIDNTGDLSIAGVTWAVNLTEQDGKALGPTYDRLYMQFDHENYHVGKYQHLTCPMCVGEAKANQARKFRLQLRHANKAEEEKYSQQLRHMLQLKHINNEQYAARMEQLRKAYGLLARDLELHRWKQHQQQPNKKQQ